MTTADRYRNKSRNDLYKLLQVGKRELGWSEKTYREKLAEHGAKPAPDGRVSASSLDTRQLIDVLQAMHAAGFTPRRRNVKTLDWREPRIKKIIALWCALADAGQVRERGYASMEKWCRSLTRVNKLEWASARALNDCIEALKSWAHRKGVQLRD